MTNGRERILRLADLKRAYNDAVRDGREVFRLGEYEFLTAYAKYLLEYLAMHGVPDGKPLRSFLVPSRTPD